MYKGVNGLKNPKLHVTCNKGTADYDPVRGAVSLCGKCGAARAEI